MKKLYAFFLSILLFNCINVYADYLPINYSNERYNNTTVWYSIIPSKYKMHYAYGGDVIGKDEKPSLIAKRHNATVAINTQHMGSVKIEGTNSLLERGNDVSKYDFYVINGIKDSYSNYKSGFGKNEAHMIATSTTSSKVGIDLSNVVDPIWCTDVMCFIPLVSNGKIVDNWYNNWDKINNGSYLLACVNLAHVKGICQRLKTTGPRLFSFECFRIICFLN